MSGLVAALSLPQPPLLVPGATGGPVAEVETLRAACLDGIATVLASTPDRLVLVGGMRERERGQPSSLTVGCSLLEQSASELPVTEVPVPASLAPAACRALGEELAAGPGRIGLIVMADGSARRTVKAPGYLDERAAAFDDGVLKALRSADAGALDALDPELAADLLAAGRAAWQVLGGALAAGGFVATTLYADDPFGVFYPVVGYQPA